MSAVLSVRVPTQTPRLDPRIAMVDNRQTFPDILAVSLLLMFVIIGSEVQASSRGKETALVGAKSGEYCNNIAIPNNV